MEKFNFNKHDDSATFAINSDFKKQLKRIALEKDISMTDLIQTFVISGYQKLEKKAA